jgi:hypothetical protein
VAEEDGKAQAHPGRHAQQREGLELGEMVEEGATQTSSRGLPLKRKLELGLAQVLRVSLRLEPS